MNPDERHYNVKKLNVIFALSSLALLLAISGLFINDYSREWKKYQKDFQVYELEKARVKLDKESVDLAKRDDFNALVADMEKKRQELQAKCADPALDEQIKKLRAVDDLAQQQYKFNKAALDASKYRFEEARAHNPAHLPAAQKELNELERKNANLKLAAEQSAQALKDKEKTKSDCFAELAAMDKEYRKIVKQKDIIEQKLDKIDPEAMSFSNQMAQMVRDLPIIDLANPNLRLSDKQIVLNNLRDDVNFVTVPKVERCTACHLGIANPDYVNAPQPFTTHPKLEMYLGKDSAHPLEEFGCTVCHGGRARGTTFTSAVHTPASEEQAKEWEKKYNWHRLHLWEEPMLPVPYVEAGCFKCHSGETTIKGADKLNLGLHLIEKAGCYNCHVIEKYAGWPKSGPDLTKLSAKISKDWAYKWIHNPQSFRHNAWMPSFFDQSNNNDPESKARSEQEIHAVVHYLYKEAQEYPLKPVPFEGDPKEGEELVASLGCFACHQILPAPDKNPVTKDTLRQQQGPNLIGLGSKTSKEWIFNWLRNPSSYHSETRMPDLRLTDKEAADIAAYLSHDRNKDFDSQPVPPMNERILDDITFGFLARMDTHAQAETKLKSMTAEDKLYFSGKKLVGQYGCFSCHNIKGFDGAKPIGAELTNEGEKTPHDLDFGFVHIDHEIHTWFKQKLLDPRIFDKGKIKAPDEKLRMPNFHFTDEEADAIVTAVMGFVGNERFKDKIKPRTPGNLKVEEGQKIVRQLNCQGCHNIEGEGGTVKKSVNEWLVKYENHPQADADKFTDSYSPPQLYGLGKKVNPQWLFEFLHQPDTKIRPWIQVRMPTFKFNAAHLNILIKYFNALDNAEFPFEDKVDTSLSSGELAVAQKMFSKEVFDCQKCHVVGGQMPSGSPETWAPDLARSKAKLRPDWVIEWIKNPTKLIPGTKMPTFFDPADYANSGPPDILGGNEDEQIRILRNFLMTLSDQTPAQAKQNTAETKQ